MCKTHEGSDMICQCISGNSDGYVVKIHGIIAEKYHKCVSTVYALFLLYILYMRFRYIF